MEGSGIAHSKWGLSNLYFLYPQYSLYRPTLCCLFWCSPASFRCRRGCVGPAALALCFGDLCTPRCWLWGGNPAWELSGHPAGRKRGRCQFRNDRCQIYRRIVLPQAFVLSIPPLVNEVISTLKGTALIFNVGIVDVMRQAELMGGNSQRYLELYVDVAILYGAMIFALTLLGRALEHHFRISEDTLTVIGGEYE